MTAVVWSVYAFIALIKLNLDYLLICALALTLIGSNIVGFVKCSKGAPVARAPPARRPLPGSLASRSPRAAAAPARTRGQVAPEQLCEPGHQDGGVRGHRQLLPPDVSRRRRIPSSATGGGLGPCVASIDVTRAPCTTVKLLLLYCCCCCASRSQPARREPAVCLPHVSICQSHLRPFLIVLRTLLALLALLPVLLSPA